MDRICNPGFWTLYNVVMFLFRIFVFCVQERDVKLYLQLLRRTLLPKTQIFTLISNPNAKLEKKHQFIRKQLPFC